MEAIKRRFGWSRSGERSGGKATEVPVLREHPTPPSGAIFQGLALLLLQTKVR